MARHAALLADLRAGRLRELRWPLTGGRAPRSWVGLFAAPSLPRAEVAELRAWLAELSTDRQWRQALRRDGREVAPAGSAALARLLSAGTARADHLELLSRRVERR